MDVKKVRLLAAGGLIVAAGAGLYMATRPSKPAEPAATAETSTETPESKARARLAQRRERAQSSAAEAPQREAEPQAPKNVALREVDRSVLAYLDKGPPEEGGGKDVLPKDLAKVDVLAANDQSGRYRVWRIDIDLNRDGIVDEHWMMDKKQVERRVSNPSDRSHRTDDTYVLEGDTWKHVEGKGETAGVVPVPKKDVVTASLRPIDSVILGLIQKGLTIGDDLSPAERYKISVVDDGSGKVILVDLDRDNRFDERWRVARNTVFRSVAPPGTQQGFTESYRLEDGKWFKN